MIRFKLLARVMVIAICLGTIGCNMPTHYSDTFRLDPGGTNSSRVVDFKAPKKDQNIAIEVTSGETINVEVVLEKDKGKSKFLKKKSDTRSFSDTVLIPAGERYFVTISLRAPKSTDVTVKADSVD